MEKKTEGLLPETGGGLRWAVAGCGSIAGEMACALSRAGRHFYAAAGRNLERTAAFARRYGIEKACPDVETMLADPAVDIVYVATPHNAHAGIAEKALKAGKHVLCEKAITLNDWQLQGLRELAGERGLILAEAMTVWHMPLYKKLRGLLEEGSLGPVRLCQISFGSFKEYDGANRFFSLQEAGGALLDIGGYALSVARLFLDCCPQAAASRVKLAPTGVDERACILLEGREGQMAAVTLDLRTKLPKRAVIGCEKGYIEVMEYPRADRACVVWTQTGKRQEIEAGRAADALLYEVADMEKAVRTGRGEIMELERSADVMRLMTGLRREWGLRYPEENEMEGMRGTEHE